MCQSCLRSRLQLAVMRAVVSSTWSLVEELRAMVQCAPVPCLVVWRRVTTSSEQIWKR